MCLLIALVFAVLGRCFVVLRLWCVLGFILFYLLLLVCLYVGVVTFIVVVGLVMLLLSWNTIVAVCWMFVALE